MSLWQDYKETAGFAFMFRTMEAELLPEDAPMILQVVVNTLLTLFVGFPLLLVGNAVYVIFGIPYVCFVAVVYCCKKLFRRKK